LVDQPAAAVGVVRAGTVLSGTDRNDAADDALDEVHSKMKKSGKRFFSILCAPFKEDFLHHSLYSVIIPDTSKYQSRYCFFLK
jgi:hypothetical protein